MIFRNFVVLILILMEHAQRVMSSRNTNVVVLILILMEHAQRVTYQVRDCTRKKCLNPYFNGTCSKR